MLILIVGAVGGAGCTTLAHELLKQGKRATTVGLDMSDGTFSALIERRIYALDKVAFSRLPKQQLVEMELRRRYTLLWTAACRLSAARVWAFVTTVAQRLDLIVDGGLAPPPGVWDLAAVQLVVNRAGDDPVARWHEQQLRQAHPEIRVVTGDLKAAGHALADQLLPNTVTRNWSPRDLIPIL